jgi:hypothetical protein
MTKFSVIPKPTNTTFKSLIVGEAFNFASDNNPSFLCLCHGPWRKTSTRTYTPTDTSHKLAGMRINVGTINVEIERAVLTMTETMYRYRLEYRTMKGQSMVHSFTGTETNLNAILRHLDYRPGTLTILFTNIEQEAI